MNNSRTLGTRYLEVTALGLKKPDEPPKIFHASVGRQQNRPATKPEAVKVDLVNAATIAPEAIDWLWKGYLARGKIHVLAGRAGCGKTTLALQLASIVSTGGKWPDGLTCPAGNVVIWSGEDDLADTLVPRLAAAGADRSRCHFVGTSQAGSDKRPFDPATDLPALKDAIEKAGGASLLIVDPIVSAITGDSHKNAEVRRGLQPLVDLASATRCAVLGITHFSKGTGGQEPIERVNGSLAFGAVARVVFVAAKQGADDSEDEGDAQSVRLFVRAKSNIGPDDGGFEYDLTEKPVPNVDGLKASVAVFLGLIAGSARDALARAERQGGDQDGGSALDDAKAFLIDELSEGAVAAKVITAHAREVGIALRTLKRAKADLGVKAHKTGMRGGWEWWPKGAKIPEGGHS